MKERIYLERIEPARNMRRFYALSLTRTLFGDWALVREWGRIGSPGTVRYEWFSREGDAAAVRLKVGVAKVRRGYRAVRLK